MTVLHRPAFERRPLPPGEWPPAPPEAAERAVAVEPPVPHSVDLGKIEAAVTRKPLDEIAKKIRALTYGEMIELAEGFWKQKPEGEITQDMIPGMLHKWATEESGT